MCNRKFKKVICFVLTLVTVLTIALPALAGSIVTPNGGRAKLWKTATSSGKDYVAYISSGNSASRLNTKVSNNRYNVSAYGYNSNSVYDNYSGWINKAYYQD